MGSCGEELPMLDPEEDLTQRPVFVLLKNNHMDEEELTTVSCEEFLVKELFNLVLRSYRVTEM